MIVESIVLILVLVLFTIGTTIAYRQKEVPTALAGLLIFLSVTALCGVVSYAFGLGFGYVFLASYLGTIPAILVAHVLTDGAHYDYTNDSDYQDDLEGHRQLFKKLP